MAAKRRKIRKNRTTFRWFLFSLCLCVSAVNLSCSSKPTDLRTLVPAETLVYLETNDLAAALQPIVDAKPFREVAKSKPDFSALKGVQLAVAITGFETSEEKLTDEHSVGRVQPRFVAVAETHAWNYQANAFAEQKLGSFVREIYDSEPTLEKSDKNGGKYFKWTATDGRKAYALVIESLIYFGNDETAIDKCLAVKRGESDSIIKTGKIPTASLETLASGYISTDGIAQIANIIGLKYASEIGEDSEVQSAIAGILPTLLRNSLSSISWTSTNTGQRVEDKYLISMPPDVANIFNETMVSQGENFVAKDFAMVPPDASSATLYNFKDPLVAWRSVLLVAANQTDPSTGKIIAEFSRFFLEPYGVRDPEGFIEQLDHRITTIKFDDDGEKVVVISRLPFVIVETNQKKERRFENLPATIEPDVPAPVQGNFRVFVSGNSALKAAINEEIILGDSDSVSKCMTLTDGGKGFSDIAGSFSDNFSGSKGSILTVGKDAETPEQLINFFSGRKNRDSIAPSPFATETRFTKSGMERKTTSDFGLIGLIIAQLNQD